MAKQYKVEVIETFCKDTPRYFKTYESAEKYAETIKERTFLGQPSPVNVFILTKTEEGCWYVVKTMKR